MQLVVLMKLCSNVCIVSQLKLEGPQFGMRYSTCRLNSYISNIWKSICGYFRSRSMTISYKYYKNLAELKSKPLWGTRYRLHQDDWRAYTIRATTLPQLICTKPKVWVIYLALEFHTFWSSLFHIVHKRLFLLFPCTWFHVIEDSQIFFKLQWPNIQCIIYTSDIYMFIYIHSVASVHNLSKYLLQVEQISPNWPYFAA